MKRTVIASVLLIASLAPTAAAQKILTIPRLELRLGYPTRPEGLDWRAIDAEAQLPASEFLSIAANPRNGMHSHELTIADGALRGVQIGTTVGMFVGALGNVFGAWDERTTWILTGALAATGGILGGAEVEYGDNWRYELRWDDR